MKSLIQYLFEALVNGPELEKNLKFEETDIDEILDILDTDEYNHFVELTGKRYDKNVVKEGVFLLNNSTHFKIMYEGNLLGIFSVCLPENFNNLMSAKGKNKYAKNDFELLNTLFYPFFKAAIDGVPYDVIDENIYKDVIEDYFKKTEVNSEILKDYDDDMQKKKQKLIEYSEKVNALYDEFVKTRDKDIKAQMDSMNNKYNEIADDIEKAEKWKKIIRTEVWKAGQITTKELVKRIMSITGFVVIWQLSKDAKKKIDVNQVSLLKIFFQKLTELIKNTGAKYIMAQGKDEHVTNAYIKLGGFNRPEELFKKYAADYNENDREFLEGTVIKRI